MDIEDIINPYETPSSYSDLKTKSAVASVPKRWISKRQLAALLVATPLVGALPIRFWVLHIAGGWLVSSQLEFEHRQALLSLVYFPLMMSMTILALFPAFLLLWLDRWYTIISSIATIFLGLLMIPSLFFLAVCVATYLKYDVFSG